MKTIRDYYAACIEYREVLLKEIIELIVFEKKLMTLDQPMNELMDKYLTPPVGKGEAWDKRFIEALAEMRAKKERVRIG